MNRPTIVWLLFSLFVPVMSLNAQGTFQNMNFEEANPVAIVGDPFGRYSLSSTIPGWNVSYGQEQQNAVFYNYISLWPCAVSIIGPDSNQTKIFPGQYYARLQPGRDINNAWTSASISQQGIIPADANFLLVIGNWTDLNLLINGNDLSWNIYEERDGYKVY